MNLLPVAILGGAAYYLMRPRRNPTAESDLESYRRHIKQYGGLMPFEDVTYPREWILKRGPVSPSSGEPETRGAFHAREFRLDELIENAERQADRMDDAEVGQRKLNGIYKLQQDIEDYQYSIELEQMNEAKLKKVDARIKGFVERLAKFDLPPDEGYGEFD